MSKLKQQLTVLSFLFAIIMKCMCETVPEDLLTDNDEQLYKLQRDDLVDSIMDRIEPRTSEQTEKEVKIQPQGKSDQTKVVEELHIRLNSIFPSPSRFSSADIETIKIHTSKNIPTPVIDKSKKENTTTFQSITSTPKLGISASKRQSSLFPSIETSSSSDHENISTSYTFTDTIGNSTSILPIHHIFVSSMITSTESLSISTLLAPHSISVLYDTAPLTIQPTRTTFVVDQLLLSSSITETPRITIPRKIQSTGINLLTSKPISDEVISRKMPSIPDEHGYGGFIPTTLKNEKSMRFIYINILLPIIAGITGALFITFSILLFRCCRRRKLKKVRYFGAKNRRDIVHFDQMNLLTDTSDEDDFD